MKKIALLLLAIFFALNFSYAQWGTNGNNIYNSNSGNVGLGTTSPGAVLDVGKLLSSGDLSTVLARLPEGNSTGGGTYLGIKGYDTQPTVNTPAIIDIKSFSIEHSFYGLTNNSINFLRGMSGTGGSISFNTNDNTEKMRILYNGNIGIGTSSPRAKLDVNGNQLLNGDLTFTNDKTAYFIHGSGNGGAIRIRSNANAADDRNLQFGNIDDNGVWYGYMIVDQTGNVGIGTINPQNKLDVNGNIHSKQVTVDVSGWNDYVFDKKFNLRPLSSVKTYIEANHHLPEIPSEQEIVSKGLDLGEMNKLLMKKVEELTLYLIEKDKQLTDQQAINQQQAARFGSQQDQIDQLRQQLKRIAPIQKPKQSDVK